MSYASRIEIASYEDTEALVTLLESVGEQPDDVDPDFTRFFIIRDKKKTKIIGCVGLELFTGTALLRLFAVDPEHQKTKVGATLVKRLLDEAAKAGSETVYVCEANAPDFFWDNDFMGIDLDDVPDEIRDSKLFIRDCPHVAAFVKKRVL
ncbi:MAG: GNAT family N-acetyltransferase [Candidatus Thorarchaeota archaeon]|jgi:N-acetylglutamate synthase-like GNAT family acetyltransferase